MVSCPFLCLGGHIVEDPNAQHDGTLHDRLELAKS